MSIPSLAELGFILERNTSGHVIIDGVFLSELA